MIDIAGGIILAVLFFVLLFAFFPLILFLIGIGLLISVGVGIYFLLINFVSTGTAKVIVLITAIILMAAWEKHSQ
jgi:hypothetical protein